MICCGLMKWKMDASVLRKMIKDPRDTEVQAVIVIVISYDGQRRAKAEPAGA